jgi:hypothetical protein
MYTSVYSDYILFYFIFYENNIDINNIIYYIPTPIIIKSMYAEEYLPEDTEDYFNASEISIDETSTIDTETKNHLKIKEVYKRMDKDYYSYKIKVDNENIKIELYSSPSLSKGFIRNAITGIRSQYKVGSKYEDLFFKVKDIARKNQTVLNDLPRKLFYDSPEECERHLHIIIPKEVKENWMKNKKLIKPLKI